MGAGRVYPGTELYCYAGSREGGTATRLVLEGFIDGNKCFYAIELPPMEAASVIELDVTLRRMGTDSPDIPADAAALTVETYSKPWEENEPYEIIY